MVLWGLISGVWFGCLVLGLDLCLWWVWVLGLVLSRDDWWLVYLVWFGYLDDFVGVLWFLGFAMNGGLLSSICG